jgi:hypothetical protein
MGEACSAQRKRWKLQKTLFVERGAKEGTYSDGDMKVEVSYGVDWINLAEDTGRLRAVVNTQRNFRFHDRRWIF